MRLSEKQRDFTVKVAELILWAYGQGYELTYGEVFRTIDQQHIYFKSGRSKTLKSKHLDRLAVDFNLFIDGRYVRDRESYRALGEKWEEIGGRWGGRFGVDKENYSHQVGWDPGHFEYNG